MEGHQVRISKMTVVHECESEGDQSVMNAVVEELTGLKVEFKATSKNFRLPSGQVPDKTSLVKYKSDNSRIKKLPQNTDDKKQKSLKIVRRDEVVPKITAFDSEFIELVA